MDTYKKFKPGKSHEWKGNRFYAMNGAICFTDPLGEFQVLTCRQWETRTRGINDQAVIVKQMATETPHKWLYDQYNETINLVHLMHECWVEAKEQGDHNDPAVSAWFQKHKPDVRASSYRGATPGITRPSFEINRPSATLPVGDYTGRTVDGDEVPINRPVQDRALAAAARRSNQRQSQYARQAGVPQRLDLSMLS